MTAPYYTLLTNIGAAKLANATATDTPLNITQMGVGDANGTVPTPDPRQTSLIHECRRADLNTLKTDPNNPNQIIAEQVIPDNVGGWYIRELGLYDADGDLIAVGNCPPSYKPLIEEGASREQVIRMILIVTSDDAVTLKIDPAVVLATREYVDDSIEAHAKSRNHPDATTKAKGLVQLSSDTDSDDETKAATPKAVKAVKATADAAVKTVNNAEPDEHGNVKLGSAADADIVTSMTDTTAGRATVPGWEGLGGYALQTTDAELQSQNRLPTRFFLQGNGDADKRFGHFGSGVHIEYGTDGNGVEYSSNIFVRADGNIIVEWLQVNADGSVNLQKQQMLFGPFNLPSAADIRAVALSSVFAKADTDIADASALPANTVSFCYSDAAFSPGYEATILDVGGLGDGSGYRVQYAASYADGGKQLKFRTLNGDNGYWGSWTNVITNYGGDVDHLSNASYYHVNPAAWPGVGAFANQYADPTAPFIIPFGRATPKDISQYLPIIKALSSTEEYGYGAAVSFGILRTGNADFGSAVIHIIGDNGNGAVFGFNADGTFNAPNAIIAGGGVYDTPGVRVYSSNNPPPTYPSQFRTGARTKVGNLHAAGDWSAQVPQGAVNIASLTEGDDRITSMYYAYPQYLINGNWVNFA